MSKQYRLIPYSPSYLIYEEKFGVSYKDELGTLIDKEGYAHCLRFWVNNDFGCIWAYPYEIVYVKGD